MAIIHVSFVEMESDGENHNYQEVQVHKDESGKRHIKVSKDVVTGTGDRKNAEKKVSSIYSEEQDNGLTVEFLYPPK